MPSRRVRKRERRLAANAGLRGDRQKSSTRVSAVGGEGGFRSDWRYASLSDLILLRRAVKEEWPIPLERRRPLMQAILSIIRSEESTERLLISVCQIVVNAEEINRKLDELARARKTSCSR